MRKLLILAIIIGWQFMQAQDHKSEISWLTDIKQAKKIAKKEHKPIVMLFTGSDWCPPCRAMHRDLFINEEFVKLSKKVVLVYVDFPRRTPMSAEQRQKNNELKMKYRSRGGVPAMVAITSDGKIIKEITGYRFGFPERHIKYIKAVIAYLN
jgi:thioredoxin-related protein